MVVLNGIVMGPMISFKCYNLIYYKHIIYLQHCAFDDCAGAFVHITKLSQVIDSLFMTVLTHQGLWGRHRQTHSRDHLVGVRRILQRPQELEPQQSQENHPHQRHNKETPENIRKHYFSPLLFLIGLIALFSTTNVTCSWVNGYNYLFTIIKLPSKAYNYHDNNRYV